MCGGMKLCALLALNSVFLTLAGCSSRPQKNAPVVAVAEAASEAPLDAPLPVDPGVQRGVLENGMTYYIERNQRPETRAELRLVVKAGSINEADDQLGLAHVVEHMAFNGSENFSGNALVGYLESIGVRFGADLNASTSFDATIYTLLVPTDRPDVLERAFVVLSDWAGRVSFAAEEVEKERGVVLEEWRQTRGAGGRLRDQSLPLLFHESLYQDRIPIGTEASLKSFDRDDLLRFYRTWYRPSLMAVIAVGDFDPGTVAGLVEKHFSGLREPDDPPERHYPPIPNHKETLYGTFSDPEVTSTSLSVIFKIDDVEENSHAAYRETLVEQLAIAMVNERLADVARTADSPLLGAGMGKQRLTPTKSTYGLGASVKEGRVEEALAAVLMELRQAMEQGFGADELEVAKRRIANGYERYYTERAKTDSRTHADELVRAFTTGEPIPGIPYEYRLAQRYLADIGLDEVSSFTSSWLPTTGRVITTVTPDKAGLQRPTREALAAVVADVSSRTLSNTRATIKRRALLDSPPTPGTVIEQELVPKLEVERWTLSNGMTVILKPTDFKNDQVILKAHSWGGTSTVDDDAFPSARAALGIAAQSGVGDLDVPELRRAVAGRSVSFSPWVAESAEGFDAASSSADLELLLQWIHVQFTNPRLDEQGLELALASQREALRNRLNRPQSLFDDAFTEAMWQGFARYAPWTLETLDRIDLDQARRFLRSRFANAADFTVVIAGSFSSKEVRPLLERYLASLPGDPAKREAPKDLGARRPTKMVKRVIRRGVDQQAALRFVMHGPWQGKRDERYQLNALVELLSMRLREELREELGGTYGVQARASLREQPAPDYVIGISFQSDPQRVDELVTRMHAVFDELRAQTLPANAIEALKNQQRRTRETSLKTNGFWASLLLAYARRGEPLIEILEYEQMVSALTPNRIRQAARKWLRPDRSVDVRLLPSVKSPQPSKPITAAD